MIMKIGKKIFKLQTFTSIPIRTHSVQPPCLNHFAWLTGHCVHASCSLKPCIECSPGALCESPWAQLFEGRLALNPGFKSNPSFFLLCSKAFSRIISLLFLEPPIINLQTKGIKTEMLSKLSQLNSNIALTSGYLNPALNYSALVSMKPI